MKYKEIIKNKYKEVSKLMRKQVDEEDMVNNPPHYNTAGIECIDAIQAMTDIGYEYYLQGKIQIRIIADADTEEFALDIEEIPSVIEDIINDLMHEIAGITTKDITVKVIK